jgi:hypothetical protein
VLSKVNPGSGLEPTEQHEMDSRDEKALKRATIVEKWCCCKIKKALKQSEKLWKEVGPG